MNPVEKTPKGVKLRKRQKAQKQGSENANLKVKLNVDEVSFTKLEKNQDISINSSEKRKLRNNMNEEDSLDMNSGAPTKNFRGGKKNKTETANSKSTVPIKSILKKRQNESDDSNPKKKVKFEGLTNKKRKCLHLNKKKKIIETDKVNDSLANINEAMIKGNLSKEEWKELKKQKKKLIMEKKGKGEPFELTQTLKNLWEDLRSEDCLPERKSWLLKQACDLLKGCVKEFTFAHDTVRVLKCILSEGAETHQTLLLEKLNKYYRKYKELKKRTSPCVENEEPTSRNVHHFENICKPSTSNVNSFPDFGRQETNLDAQRKWQDVNEVNRRYRMLQKKERMFLLSSFKNVADYYINHGNLNNIPISELEIEMAKDIMNAITLRFLNK